MAADHGTLRISICLPCYEQASLAIAPRSLDELGVTPHQGDPLDLRCPHWTGDDPEDDDAPEHA